jgi:hypothetical protein
MRSHISPGGDARNITRNLEAEFNEVELLPRTKEATIMATVAYIAANASNDDEHMRHLLNLALEGVRVLQGTNEQDREATPRRNIPPVEPSRHQAAAPAVAPRPQAVEPINGELRHGLAQNKVDSARARRDARRFEEEAKLEAFGNSRHGLCGAECFSFLICSTPLPKGIKLSDGVVKFNEQQDPRIWLDGFITVVTISGRSRDNALQLLSLHLGVKTEQIWKDSSETVFVTGFFFGFRIRADNMQIRIRNRSLSVMNKDRIWSEYGSVADKHFTGSLVDNKVKLACIFFYIRKYIEISIFVPSGP